MTREERAQRWLADYFDQHGKHGGADELRDGRMITMTSITAVNAMLSFANAETAAMRERAAAACEEQATVFLSPKYATGQPLSSMMERFACGQCAEAIRALPATGEVGRG